MIVLIVSFLLGALSLAAIVYPYRPFSSRKRASIVFAMSAVAFLASPFLVVMGEQEPIRGYSEGVVALEGLGARSELFENGDSEVVSGSSASVSPMERDQTGGKSVLAQGDFEGLISDIKRLSFESVTVRLNQFERNGYDLEPVLSDLEGAALEVVRPLPMSNVDANLAGYRLLSSIRPENKNYVDKVKAYEQRKEELRLASVRLLRTEKDKIEGVTWYKHPNQPKYLNSRSTVYLYIGQKGDGRPWLRMKVIYTSSDWLFVKSVIAWHDGIKEPFVSGKFERDNNSSIWEWVDVAPSEHQIAVLESFSTADEAILRFEGGKYHRDVTLSTADKRALKEVIEAFRVLTEE